MKSLMMLLLLLLITTACEPRVMPYEEYKDVILPGMDREEAIKVLQETAWYHQECPYTNPESGNFFIHDLFFFGSHHYDEAELLIVVSYQREHKLSIDHIGTFEPYAWHTAYADCIERERFEN